MPRSSERFAIAHVTPYPWEAQENEVNEYVRARERAPLRARSPRAGDRPLALAGAGARTRRALRATRGRSPDALLAGSDRGEPDGAAVGRCST